MLKIDTVIMQSAKPDDAPILNRVSLSVAPNSITSVLGPSGAGKTSLLRVVMGLEKTSAGRVLYGDQLLSEDEKIFVSPAERGFGYLFQEFTLFPHLTVWKNLAIGLNHLTRAEQKGRLAELSELLGISHLHKRSIDNLSGGEQQRVALARTLALHPKVLLLDEPFSNLDKMTKYQLWHDVKQIIRDKQITTLIATHDQQEAFFFSDRLAIMREGYVVAEESPVSLYETPQTEWIARFTGEAHCLEGEKINHIFQHEHQLRDECKYLVRPEYIRILADGDARVVENEFYGFYSSVTVETLQGQRLRVVQTGSCQWKAGAKVRLVLGDKPKVLQS